MNIGWVGLGQIGTQMVRRVLAGGFRVAAFSRGEGRAAAAAAGADLVADYASLAAASDALFLCVYQEAQLDEVLFAGGALAAMRPGSLLVVHTTASPDALRRIAESAGERGIDVLDACFSGGPAEVEAGRLTLMVGGTAPALARARPALECYAARIDHLGKVGLGQMAKLFNNLLFATNLMNAAELLRMAGSHGLASTSLAGLIQSSSGTSYAMDLFSRTGAEPDALLAGVRHYLEKDVASAVTAAGQAGIDISAFAPTQGYFAPQRILPAR